MVETRQSTGKLPPKRVQSESDLDEDSDFQLDSEKPKKKRARTRKSIRKDEETFDGQDENDKVASSSSTTRKPARRRLAGTLTIMMSMPIDVFCEIAHYLGPDDLLRLSRAIKAFRELLMSKSSVMIWRAAEKAIGLPKCPDDLSSPQYASFIFDKFCTLCFKGRSVRCKHIVSLRIRLCQNCSSTQIVRGDAILRKIQIKDYPGAEVWTIIPTTNCSPVFTKIESLPDFGGFGEYHYYLPSFKAISSKYSSFKEDYTSRKKYVSEKREALCQMSTGILELEEWIQNWVQTAQQEKIEDKLSALSNRENDILGKLRDLGHTDEDFRDDNDNQEWKWEELIKQPARKLTDRAWESLRPQLEETIRLRREKIAFWVKKNRLVKREEKIIQLSVSFVNSNEGKGYCIPPFELFKLPLLQEVLNNDETGAVISSRHWNLLKQKMLDLSGVRRHELATNAASSIMKVRRESGLQDIFQSSLLEDSAHGSQYGPVDKDTILQHPTSIFYRGSLKTFSDHLKDLKEHCLGTFRRRTCHGPEMAQPKACYLTIADALYGSVGIGVASTLDDMMTHGKSFICMRCIPLKREPLSWIGLVGHFCERYKAFQDAKEYIESRKHFIKDKMERVGIHEHDVEQPIQLAVYTGNQQQSAEKLISPCQ